MKKVLQMIYVLTFVGLVSGATLVFVYQYADPLIAENQANETKEAVFKIFPDAKNYKEETIAGEAVFRVNDKNGKLLGYAFVAAGNGYQGTIKLMAGIENDLETLVGIEVLESQETPGLGQEIIQPEFKSQFRGLKASPEITYIKNQKPTKPNEIEAITGATVSSSAVVTILNERIKIIKEHLK